MKTGCGDNGGARWEPQCKQPDAEAWQVPMAFSPYAPWGKFELYWSFLFPDPTTYIVAPSDAIFERFEKSLLAQQLLPTCAPRAREIAYLIDVTRKRTAEQERTIISQLDLMKLILPLTSLVDPEPKLSLLDLIDRVVRGAYRPLFFAKVRFNRVRCYQLVPELAPGFLPDRTFPMHASFPSGHSTQAHLIVNVLVSVFGQDVERKARNAAWDIGTNREIAGLHYPSDTYGGKCLADVLIAEAESNPKYTAARDAVRKEYGL